MAIIAMRLLRKAQKEIITNDNFSCFQPFNLRLKKRLDLIHWIGLSPPILIPIIFSGAWIYAWNQL
jgi:hypothetical protein